jgi:hypothetical protein
MKSVSLFFGDQEKADKTKLKFPWRWTVRGSNSGRGKRFFFSKITHTGSWSHTAPCSMGYWSLFRGAKRPERKVDQSPLSSAEAKNEWSYIATPPISLQGVARDNFTFYTSTVRRIYSWYIPHIKQKTTMMQQHRNAFGLYLLTSWSRVLHEKLTVNFAASQEIPRVYGTPKFLSVPTSARHLSLS